MLPNRRGSVSRSTRARVELDIDVVVRAGRAVRAHQPQTARHAEMNDQRSIAGFEHEVFGTPQNAHDAFAAQALRQHNGPTKARLPQLSSR